VGLVTGTIIIVGLIFAYRKYDKQHKRRRLFNDSEMNDTTPALTVFNNDQTIHSTPNVTSSFNETTVNKTSNVIQTKTVSSPTEMTRVPSAALSVTTLDASKSLLPPVELVRLD
jgi:hypothetical protein